jgi:hypothetical protein
MANHTLTGVMANRGTLSSRLGIGTGVFGVFKLGNVVRLFTLPELTEFRIDPVRQGGMHILLGGKAREDVFGDRRHFYLGWEGLTEAEWDIIEMAYNVSDPLLFRMHNDDCYVVRANHGPKEYDTVGNIKTSIQLDESA